MTGPADLVIRGRVATLAGTTGFGWVEAVAIRDGRVVAAGRWTDVEMLGGPRTRRWHLDPDLCVVPGVTDAHLHLGTAIRASESLDLTGLADRAAVLGAVAAAHESRLSAGDVAGWLEGHGWSLDQLQGWPTAAELEAVAPGRPIACWSHDHHARWVSEAALAEASITPATPDPPNGLIRRGSSDAPSGVLHEAATVLVDASIPGWSSERRERSLAAYARRLTALGVTGIHDPGDLSDATSLHQGPAWYRSLADDDRLPIRVAGSVREQRLDDAIEAGMRTGEGVGRYQDGWLKLFADGALGSRTAALLTPYEHDDPAGPAVGGPAGMVTHDPTALREVAGRAAARGIAVQIHAIGDAAVRTVLDVLAEVPRIEGPRHRIEHAQLVDPSDVPRFGRLGIAASVQPCHLCSDAVAVRAAWGDRSRHAFPLASLDAAGALIPFGTDAPVEPPDPWRGIAAAVTRADPTWPKERPALHPEQALAVDRGLRAACLDPALTLGAPDRGRLIRGAVADLAVIPVAGLIDAGPAGATLAATRPLVTLIDGAEVYRSDAFDP